MYCVVFFFLMIRRPPRSTQSRSSAASDVYKRQAYGLPIRWPAIPVDETLAAMKHDKKARAGTLKFIVADRIGHVVQRTDISENQARAALLALR